MGESAMDVIELAKDLMQYETVSPVEDDAIFDHMKTVLAEEAGIEASIKEYDGVKNLVCTVGTGDPAVCFNGHVDVVPPGEGWSETDPFDPVIKDGRLYGRGAADMKTGVAAQLAAVVDLVNNDELDGSVTLMVAGDEEQGGFAGTKRMVQEQEFDYVIVGEPTDLDVQVGTRGVIWIDVYLKGQEAHASKPHLGVNVVEDLPDVLDALNGLEMDYDAGNALPAPNAEVTVVETDDTQNSVPGKVRIGMDIRYGVSQDPESIVGDVRMLLEALGVDYDLEYTDHGGAFLLDDTRFRETVVASIETVTGTEPEEVTSGGASDGRFFSERGTPFVELGVEQETVHQADESCPVDDIRQARQIYRETAKRLLEG